MEVGVLEPLSKTGEEMKVPEQLLEVVLEVWISQWIN